MRIGAVSASFSEASPALALGPVLNRLQGLVNECMHALMHGGL